MAVCFMCRIGSCGSCRNNVGHLSCRCKECKKCRICGTRDNLIDYDGDSHICKPCCQADIDINGVGE